MFDAWSIVLNTKCGEFKRISKTRAFKALSLCSETTYPHSCFNTYKGV